MISIIVITLLLIIVILIVYNKNIINERYIIGFTKRYYKPIFFRNTVTPLIPLVSPLKIFPKDKKLTNFFLCNPKLLSGVRDQKQCGGCWSYTVTGVLADLANIQTGHYIENLNASRLLNCYDSGNGCEGENPENVFIWLENTQFKLDISREIEFRGIGKCEHIESGFTVKPGSSKSLCKYIENTNDKISTEERTILDENIYNMKMQLVTSGPFFASIAVYDNFLSYKGYTVYKKEKKSLFVGGHAIEIVGYVDRDVDVRNNFKEPYWIFKNSWGNKWASATYGLEGVSIDYGLSGYGMILMGENECGVESRCGIAELNIHSKKPKYDPYEMFEFKNNGTTVKRFRGNPYGYNNYYEYFAKRLNKK
jgi:hypothetical protein